MKKHFFTLSIIAFAGIFIFNSCKKEKSCEGCKENIKSPIVIAGPGQVKGMGHAEGMFRYDAEIENGEKIHFEEAFKLYMINEDGYWRIFYFVFPGFAW